MWSESVEQKDWFIDLFFLLYNYLHKCDLLSITDDLNGTTLSRRQDSIGNKKYWLPEIKKLQLRKCDTIYQIHRENRSITDEL